MLAGHRLPDPAGDLRLAVQLPAHRPGEPVVRRPAQLRRRPHRPGLWWRDARRDACCITVVTVVVELVLGFALALVMVKALQHAAAGAARGDPHPLRRSSPWSRRSPGTSPSTSTPASSTAGSPGCPASARTPTGSAHVARSLFVMPGSEIWKTTPFISLLLLAGLAQVPEVLQEAAKVDGATWWQRMWKVTIPNMKAAIMVALLFRTLDAFRIFDNIFIMTDGANGTESVSFLAYRQTISPAGDRAGLGGLGAAVRLRDAHLRRDSSRASRSTCRRRRGETVMSSARRPGRGSSPASLIVLLLRCSRSRGSSSLSFKAPADHLQRTVPADRRRRGRTTSQILVGHRQDLFLPALRNSFGICLIATAISVHPGDARRLRDRAAGLPGQAADPRPPRSAVAIFPVISIVTPLFNLWRQIGLYDTWPGLIIPYLSLTLPISIWTLSAFFREIPWEMEQAAQVDGATTWQAFRKVIVPLAAPGRVHHGDHRVLHRLERLRLRHLADLDRGRPAGARGAGASSPARRSSRSPTGAIAAAAVIVTIPVVRARPALPAADRRRPHQRRGQGLTRRTARPRSTTHGEPWHPSR